MAEAIIIEERLARIADIPLAQGAHSKPPTPGDPGEMCAMEMVAWLADEPWSDHPRCTCPIIAAFVRNWQDNLPDDKRQTLIKPLVPKLIGTRGSADVERRRVIIINDWLIRVDTPAWLRLAGLEDQAKALESLPEITDFETTPALRAALEAAERDASAAEKAARDARAARAAWAAWDARAARAAWAAWDAWDAWAAWAAWDAWDAWAARAARAAWDGDMAKLEATVAHLDAQGVKLIERLIECR